jgi:hypothetical protein
VLLVYCAHIFGLVEASTTRGTTALVYCLINSGLYTGTVHRWWSTPNWLDGRQGCSQLSTGLPQSSGLGWEEKRSCALSVGETDTAPVEAVKALPVPGVQKPPRQVGKRFRDRRVAAPEKRKVKRPAGLKTRPACLRQDCLGASPAVCCGDAGCLVTRAEAVQALKRLTATTLSHDPTLMVKSRGRDAGPRRGRRRAAEGVEPGRPDEPRQGGQRAVRLAARWAGRC